jgi:aspartyl-tRNA(Asn)/glutamyl-tRNA(Gln) amidotransferase subunit C
MSLRALKGRNNLLNHKLTPSPDGFPSINNDSHHNIVRYGHNIRLSSKKLPRAARRCGAILHSIQYMPLCYNSSAMALTIKEVRHIAQLARLKLTPEEERRYTEQLSDILDYAGRLSKIDTSTIPPTANVLPLRAPLRPDVVRPCPPQELILRNAPSDQEGMFRVPPVLDT